MKKQINNFLLINLLAFLFLLGGCKKGVPSSIISPGKMELILYDYHLAKAMADELPANERYKQSLYFEYVFKKYNVTQEIFDSSMVWYSRHTVELNNIYQNVNERFKSQQESLDYLIALHENKPITSPPGDSIDIWFQKRLYLLSSYSFNNKINFLIPTDSNYKERDLLIWKMNYTFFQESEEKDSAFMAISIKFENDSIISEGKKIFFSGKDSISITSDSLYKIKEINGFVYYLGLENEKNLLIDQIQLMRYHREFSDTISIENVDSINTVDIKEEGIVDKTDNINIDTLKRDTLQKVIERKSPQQVREDSKRNSNK